MSHLVDFFKWVYSIVFGYGYIQLSHYSIVLYSVVPLFDFSDYSVMVFSCVALYSANSGVPFRRNGPIYSISLGNLCAVGLFPINIYIDARSESLVPVFLSFRV